MAMMKLETTSSRDWQGFTRILEVMTFIDEIEDRSEEEIRNAVEQFCQLPTNPGQTMSLEEVVFWAGVATGMEFSRRAQAESDVDSCTADRMLVFASLFAHSMKNAIVDLAIGELEPQTREPWRDMGIRFRH